MTVLIALPIVVETDYDAHTGKRNSKKESRAYTLQGVYVVGLKKDVTPVLRSSRYSLLRYQVFMSTPAVVYLELLGRTPVRQRICFKNAKPAKFSNQSFYL